MREIARAALARPDLELRVTPRVHHDLEALAPQAHLEPAH